MTAKEIAKKSWKLWNDYYKDGDKGSEEILSELESDIEALRQQDVSGSVCDHYYARKSDGTLMPCEFCGCEKDEKLFYKLIRNNRR